MTGITCALAGGTGATLTTTIFTANGTWVAPAGVSNVVTLSGKGSNGVSDYIGVVSSGQYYASPTTTAQATAAFAQWATLYNTYTTNVATISGVSFPGYGPSSFGTIDQILVDSSNKWGRSQFSTNLSTKYLTGYSTGTYGSPPTSGNITYAGLSPGLTGWTITVNGYIQGNAGTASTALGQTFPGGTYTGSYPNGVGGTAATTTFTDVAVTPGASYSIVVPSGGQVSISYYS